MMKIGPQMFTSVGTNPALTSFSETYHNQKSGTIDLGSFREFNDLFHDSSVIKFGNDQEILLTHDFDKGLT